MTKSRSSEKSSKFYIGIIMIFSFIIALIMTIQIENEWYKPEPRSCNSIEFNIIRCSEGSDNARFEFSSPQNAPDVSIQVNRNSLGILEEGRQVSGDVELSSEYVITPSDDEGYTCHSKVQTFAKSDMGSC